jgi:exopolysaccharide biosynthesis protein
MFMYDHGIEIVRSTEIPDYPSLVDKCNGCDNIIACGPVLIDNGEQISYRDITESTAADMKRKKPFYLRRHPRSLVGCDAEGNIYMVVVDGRAKGLAEGMSIAELTKLSSWLGLVEAMNLDGGGSSALWSRKYGVLNHPCDNKQFDHEGERKVSSTLVAKRRK